MLGVALIAHFDGEPEDLTRRFGTAAARYAHTQDAAQPETALLLRNKDGITVVLVWPDGTSLQPFRTFLINSLGDLGLPHPRVEHLRASAVTWDALAHTDDNI
jgi:hypothetical protein